ncbi:MAG: hypothetical protein HQ557_05105 [Bacteroidetes bacterium]|nr:hypothetical protein [Bacteroidota bacterium]
MKISIVLMIILLTVAGCSSIPREEHISVSHEYKSLQVPLIRQTNIPSAGVEETGTGKILLNTGEYTLTLDGEMLLLTHGDLQTGIALRPLGEDANLFSFSRTMEVIEESERCSVAIHGSTTWADFSIELILFPYNPGLIHYTVELAPFAPPPAGTISPEWCFTDIETGTASSGGYVSYADRAPGAAPSLFGYTEALNSTIMYWTDLTRLNDFCQAVHYSPAMTPVRRGYTFGHNFGWNHIRQLPENSSCVIYDSYLYITPDKPTSEEELSKRYLSQVSDIYDLLARPGGKLPDWKKLAEKTIIDLSDPDTFIVLNGKRYWRAYVGDTRKTAEVITQLDIGVAAARYKERYGGTEQIEAIIYESLSTLDDFYNPKFGLIQNSGPLAVTGDQGRGDTWYELGHALKAAEWGLLGYKEAADMAKKSRDSWIDFANAVNYRFPQFYIFNEWQGTGREPDAAGGYALYMIRLSDLYEEETEKNRCLQEAMNAVRAFPGYGFGFSYETHMTAAAAAAAAELAVRTGDSKWLEYSYSPIANLIRLSWLYEVDYGFGDDIRTFFGLCPTQRSAAITPKEQYEAWIYLTEYLKLAHGKIDPAVEKLVAEFCCHTLLTLVDSIPPLVPEGIITKSPAAYDTVKYNRLDLHIPIEDMRDGWDIWGVIGQEVYGAGMAPTFAALAYEEISPGITVYSGYPIADIQKTEETCSAVTFSGVPGTFTPVTVTGCTEIYDKEGNPVNAERHGTTLLFTAEGGSQYFMHYQL